MNKTDDFIQRASLVHKGKYSYSKTVYTKAINKVIITCPEHGDFEQMAYKHLGGCGCPKCKIRYYDQESFILAAKKVHNNKYSYVKTVYTKANEKVVVTCPKHGDFLITANYHINGGGCPECSRELNKAKVYGVGVVDCSFSEHKKAYNAWFLMMKRCYDEEIHKKRPTYKPVQVCEEWHLLSNYIEWFDKHYRDGYEIDKDILGGEHKIYSPDTCCCVPRRINGLLIHSAIHRGKYPLGVTKVNNRFAATIYVNGKNNRLGLFDTAQAAFDVYKLEKEKLIKNVAKEYYDNGLIEKYVYEGLIAYEVKPYA